MVHTVPRERLALIEEIVRADRRLRGRDGTANPPPGAAMIRGYFHGVAEQDLAARTPRELALLCRSHLAFGLRRRPCASTDVARLARSPGPFGALGDIGEPWAAIS